MDQRRVLESHFDLVSLQLTNQVPFDLWQQLVTFGQLLRTVFTEDSMLRGQDLNPFPFGIFGDSDQLDGRDVPVAASAGVSDLLMNELQITLDNSRNFRGRHQIGNPGRSQCTVRCTDLDKNTENAKQFHDTSRHRGGRLVLYLRWSPGPDAWKAIMVTNRRTNCLALVILSITAAFFAGSSGRVQAQSSGTLAEQPILILRSHRLDARSIRTYILELNQQLQLNSATAEMLSQSDLQETQSQLTRPIMGQMVFMVQGLVPAAESISFSQVADAAEFERIIRKSRDAMAGHVVLEGSDGKYRQTSSGSWREELTAENDSETVADDVERDDGSKRVTVTVGVSSASGGGVQVSSRPSEFRIIEENGRRFREHHFSTTQYFRYHDGFLFSSSFEDLHNISLPSAESLQSASGDGVDAELEFFADRIPPGFRHLFWNTIQTSSGPGLQQRDDEAPADYEFRRSAGDLALAAMRTALFDTDVIRGHLTLATSDRPVSAELTVGARKNSHFSRQLEQAASGRSRFAAILDDDAGLTLHTSVRIPDAAQKLMIAMGGALRARLSDGNVEESALAVAGRRLQTTIETMAEHRNLELLLKAGWTESSGSVIYGGMQTDDNPHLLTAVFDVLTHSGADDVGADRVSMVQQGDLRLVRIQLPAPGPMVPVRISHVYLAHASACLWFAAGSENAWQILPACLERCRESGILARTPLLTGELDLHRWMSWPQDDPTGIAALPLWADRALASGPGRSTSPEDALSGRSSAAELRPELLTGVATSGGAMTGSFRVDADESGLVLHGELSGAIGRYLAARCLTTIDSRINGPGNSPSGVR